MRTLGGEVGPGIKRWCSHADTVLMRTTILALLMLIGATAPAYGEIEKLATSCERGLCFHWWPKLPSIEGWHQDREESFNFGANALAPEGFTFANAEVVMYAKAVYKPREPELESLEDLIKRDQRDFAANVPGVAITEALPIKTADGQSLRSLTFFPTNKGNWERVAYGEEGDFYLIFTISSRSLDGYTSSATAYEAMIRRYSE